ncbi:UDP-N-acetylmuramoyl-tripeptide--D-alanyl-D-alanine ligase [Puia sp. P3]|uniref:UDP-N-acetylmuramoyl-tripeptide--D-alanyl-D- alanine ligase n=1 Tax=Puia sp. P3 TaxID=3423952 RepID=UPI003D679278
MRIENLYDIYLRHPSVVTDTRQLREGDLFFALKGPSFNGNAFAIQALEAGAAYAVIDEAPTDYGAQGNGSTFDAIASLTDRLILVPDVLKTLQDLALHHRRQFNIPFIAITGSNGKTTTKELVHAVLSSTFLTYTTKGNLNNHIGIPLTILSVRPDAEFAVIEMGANHQKEIEGYCRYTLPTHGIITNIGKAHLEGFGGPEGVKKGKGELYDWLRDNGGTVFVLNDSADLRQMSRGIAHIITYGTQDADFTGVVKKETDADTFLNVSITHGAPAGTIHTQPVGDYNLPNVLVAVTIGKHFGVQDSRIYKAIEQYTPSNSRSQLIERDGNHIILDAYNANPSSMRAAIENFAKVPGGFDQKILVLGAMAELGPESLNEHRGIVDLIAQHPWRDVALVGGDFQKIDHPYRRFGDSKEAGHWLSSAGFRNVYLLIKGSRSSKMELVLG